MRDLRKFYLLSEILSVVEKNNFHMLHTRFDQKITVIFNFFKKVFIYQQLSCPFKVTHLKYHTLMLVFLPVLEALPKHAFWYCLQLLFRFFFYLLNRSKTLSFHRCLQFLVEEKVSGDQVRWIRWWRHDYGFVFGQKLTHKHRCVSLCIIMVIGFSTILCVSDEWLLEIKA